MSKLNNFNFQLFEMRNKLWIYDSYQWFWGNVSPWITFNKRIALWMWEYWVDYKWSENNQVSLNKHFNLSLDFLKENLGKENISDLDKLSKETKFQSLLYETDRMWVYFILKDFWKFKDAFYSNNSDTFLAILKWWIHIIYDFIQDSWDEGIDSFYNEFYKDPFNLFTEISNAVGEYMKNDKFKNLAHFGWWIIHHSRQAVDLDVYDSKKDSKAKGVYYVK